MNDSWDLAREHPMRTLVVSFATGLVGVALIMYFGPSGGDLYPSVLTGLCCGLIVAFVSRKEMQKGSHAVSVRVPTLTLFRLLTSVAGVALVVWGVVTSDWGLALAGLPLLVLGAGLALAAQLLNRRD